MQVLQQHEGFREVINGYNMRHQAWESQRIQPRPSAVRQAQAGWLVPQHAPWRSSAQAALCSRQDPYRAPSLMLLFACPHLMSSLLITNGSCLLLASALPRPSPVPECPVRLLLCIMPSLMAALVTCSRRCGDGFKFLGRTKKYQSAPEVDSTQCSQAWPELALSHKVTAYGFLAPHLPLSGCCSFSHVGDRSLVHMKTSLDFLS